MSDQLSFLPNPPARGRVVRVADDVPGAIYIGRALPNRGLGQSPLANRFTLSMHDRDEAIALYREWLERNLSDPEVNAALISARGKPLACWCRGQHITRELGKACHGDVILDVLDRYSDDELRAMVIERGT